MMKILVPAIIMSLSIAGCTSVESINSQDGSQNSSENGSKIASLTSGSQKKAPLRIQNGSTSAQNKKNLMRLCPGMSRQKVLAIMGIAPGISTQGMFKNPYRIEKYRSKRHVFELLIYCTDISSNSRSITNAELTPLVLMDGKLDGWGWPYWNKIVNLLKKYEEGVKPFLPPKGEKIKNTEKKQAVQ
ncbi:MAG: DUF3192 domain-containing protein [Chlorobium sp.]|nr:MAG: DUF3192 domain-containing protein [Chlorobium sp.]